MNLYFNQVLGGATCTLKFDKPQLKEGRQDLLNLFLFIPSSLTSHHLSFWLYWAPSVSPRCESSNAYYISVRCSPCSGGRHSSSLPNFHCSLISYPSIPSSSPPQNKCLSSLCFMTLGEMLLSWPLAHCSMTAMLIFIRESDWAFISEPRALKAMPGAEHELSQCLLNSWRNEGTKEWIFWLKSPPH